MTTIESFIKRLAKIGVEITFIGNYPWIYLDTINGKKVEGTYQSDHRFTAFWYGLKPGEKPHLTDITTVFKKIRETLKSNI